MAESVKICGLSTAETMDAALAAGADMVGLVFFPRKARAMSRWKPPPRWPPARVFAPRSSR